MPTITRTLRALVCATALAGLAASTANAFEIVVDESKAGAETKSVLTRITTEAR